MATEYKAPTPPSKQRPYARAYKRAFYTTISATINREEYEKFRSACQKNGTSMHAVIKKAAAEYAAKCEQHPSKVSVKEGFASHSRA